MVKTVDPSNYTREGAIRNALFWHSVQAAADNIKKCDPLATQAMEEFIESHQHQYILNAFYLVKVRKEQEIKKDKTKLHNARTALTIMLSFIRDKKDLDISRESQQWGEF